MKQTLLMCSILLCSIGVLAQRSLNYFDGTFDEAINQSALDDKNLLVITKSYSCHVYREFEDSIENSIETIDYLNSEFVLYLYDMDHSSEQEDKRMKKYNHSWRGFPQLYFVNKDEKLICELAYPLKYNQSAQLSFWKCYQEIENEWKLMKKAKGDKDIDYDTLTQYLKFRSYIYSPMYLVHQSKVIKHYFCNLDDKDIVSERNWDIIETYYPTGWDDKVMLLVAKHCAEFKALVGEDRVSPLLSHYYFSKIARLKEKKVKKRSNEYPYDELEEAKSAIEMYYQKKGLDAIITPLEI